MRLNSRVMFSLLAGLVLGVGVAPLAGAVNEQSERAHALKQQRGHANNLYIVQMIDMPVSSYTGNVPGFRATKPAPGRKIDRLSNDVARYSDYLVRKHDEALGRSGGRKVYSYTYSFNGFAAELDAAAVARLKSTSGVVNVSKDVMRHRTTNSTPAFLGLSDPVTGVWATQFGGVQNAGEGIVVAILDSGIWPENPSFSDRDANGKLVFQQIPGFNGKCTPGEEFPASKCGQKLVAAQYFGAGWGGKAGVKAAFPYEYWSARDADGHGSHTSSTAAGNANVAASAAGFNLGAISGMAPRARIATYKVCWGREPEGGCFSSDSVAAIDQAVGDGVDVINFSISGTSTNFLDPVEVAFLFAADAGVFVAASAGNDGPGASTVAHPGPWLTTVAAGTEAASFEGTVTLGNGAVYTGASIGGTVTPTPTVLSTAAGAGLPGADPTQVRLCFINTLNPAFVNGKIVVCDRGVNARTDKSAAVKQAGGVGMILANTSANSLNADLHSVPTVHVDHIAGAAIKAYVSGTPNPTASLAGGIAATVPAPDVAAFSSRGPLLASSDLLKPDIMAPGVDILAAYSPAVAGRNFDFVSGTSMSSPHIAGLGALMKQKYPTWSPMAIKSAFMTSATQQRTDSTPIVGGPFDYGAGQVVPKGAVNPGLVYDSGIVEWIGFLCGTGQLATSSCTGSGIPVVEPSNLNQASIAVDGLAGIQTVTRTVRNVGASALALTPTVSGLTGFNVTFSPTTLTVARGATATYTATFTRTTAALNAYELGAITWNGGTHSVRSPVVLRPVALAAPAEVAATPAGASYNVQFGFTGTLTTTPRGLIPAAVMQGVVPDDPDNTFDPTVTAGTIAIPIVIAAGTTYARFALFDADVAPGSDLDLYVYNSGGTLVGISGSGTSAEQVNLLNPPAGNYTVYVHGWQTAGGAPSPFKLHTWLLGNADAGNMTVTPASVAATTGGTATITLGFTSLAPATKYLGSVVYGGDAATATVPPTIVRVNTP